LFGSEVRLISMPSTAGGGVHEVDVEAQNPLLSSSSQFFMKIPMTQSLVA
jgi:hypothetical protein